MSIPAPITSQSLRAKLTKEIRLMLGGNIIDLELTPDHYEFAIDSAIDRYRQRSSNSAEDRAAFLELQPEQTEYILPSEIIGVKQIYRQGTTGVASGTGAAFDPFGAAFINQTAVGLSGGTGSLLTYELYADFLDTVGKMFGYWVNFTFNPQNHRLTIIRNIRGKETVLLQVYMLKPEEMLLTDIYSKPWIRDYAIAKCKVMIGEARGKFSTIVGPQGGSTLNGPEMKAEGLAEMERLEQEILKQIDQDTGWGFVIG